MKQSSAVKFAISFVLCLLFIFTPTTHFDPVVASSGSESLRAINYNNIDDDNNGFVDDLHGWDFQDDDANSVTGSRIHSHGTFIAGIVAGEVNTSGISGVAPGVNFTSLLRGYKFGEGDGTSFAAAHVTGVVALLRSVQSDLSISHLRAILLQSARDLGTLGRDSLYGYGLIDAKQAVEELSTSMD